MSLSAASHGSGPRRASLCVPATHLDRVRKALVAGADEVVVDLEDAVPLGEKDSARDGLREVDWSDASARGVRVAVRVNAVGTPWCHRDLEAVTAIPALASVVVPKVESRADLDFVERLLAGLEAETGRADRVGVQALVETATGLAGLAGIVSRPSRLESLVLGYADLGASLGRQGVVLQDWVPAQHALVVAARAVGVDAIDGPHLGVADDDAFRAATTHAARFGFDGKWVIHPRQVDAVVAGFTPAPEQVAYAERVLAALEDAAADGRGAVQLDGQLLDEAMAVAARRTLARVGR
ncbi:MAG TPA: CoA ester lyase [Nocardioides sp.]|nr:CoA ester lyase [Nocardioides sp.]